MARRKRNRKRQKTNLELLQSIRKPSAPPSRRIEDEKKARDKKACRGKVDTSE